MSNQPAAPLRGVTCVHASVCPGCPWIARPYPEQLRAKAARVEAALQGFRELSELRVAPTQPAEHIEHYRTRAKLVSDEHGALGLYARGTHRVVDLPECRVLDPLLAGVAASLRARLPAAPRLEGVDLARIDAQVMLTLIAQEGTPIDALERVAAELCAAEPVIASVAISRRKRGAVQLLGSSHQVVRGPSELPSRADPEGPFHYATHGAFQQVHAEVSRAIHARVRERVMALGPAPRVLELYAGSGALSLALAARGARVTAVESFAPACERLTRAASAQRLAVEVRPGDATEQTLRLARAGAQFDAVILNPPRRGLEPALRAALSGLAARHLAYVSCDPDSLARDLAHLTRTGFRPEPLLPFDMMPLTDHVETLAWLGRAEPPEPEILYRDDALLAVNKPPHEPTTPQGEHQVSLLSRVQRIAGFGQAAPVHRLDVGTSGVNLFARTPDHAAALAAALAAADKRYVALARGIVRPKGRVARPIVEQGRSLDAVTRYQRRDVVSGHSLIDVTIETGRKHQIRKHLAALGHPLVGDPRYGDRATNLHFAMRHGLDRPFLHCAAITLELDGTRREITAPLAPDLARVLARLR